MKIKQNQTPPYVDLGLPSGTLWATSNAKANDREFFNHDEAVVIFGRELPTKKQFKELIDNCQWKWNDMLKGFVITGPSSATLFLPAAGYYRRTVHNGKNWEGQYWTSFKNTCLFFYSSFEHDDNDYFIGDVRNDYGLSVRLVQDGNKRKA